ncbi:hypothetical protein C8J57DRAFT_1228469 [Mycena rebaudengoi]|nr:hypothetical protein C8J57DRAFT_1228469 [Mycena rebaudengoi]
MLEALDGRVNNVYDARHNHSLTRSTAFRAPSTLNLKVNVLVSPQSHAACIYHSDACQKLHGLLKENTRELVWLLLLNIWRSGLPNFERAGLVPTACRVCLPRRCVSKTISSSQGSTRDIATILDSRNRRSVRDTDPAAYHEAKARRLESESALRRVCVNKNETVPEIGFKELEAATWNPEIGGKFRQEIQAEIGNELNGNGKRTTVKTHRPYALQERQSIFRVSRMRDLRKLNGRGEELAQTLKFEERTENYLG